MTQIGAESGASRGAAFPRRRVAIVSIAAVLLALAIVASQLPSAGAGALLYPARRRVVAASPPMCRDTTFAGEGVRLKGWRCQATSTRRGTLIYLHGIADNRASGAGVIERFSKRGFDVVVYDSRAHGESEGEVCTYGFLEKRDLRRVMDTIDPGPIVLLGASLGAAVALQAVADDERVTAVIAAETFSDLRTVAAERVPFFLPSGLIRKAFDIAEQRGGFQVEAVSPVAVAPRIKSSVLLVHGADDTDTPADHSHRVLAALAGPKRLILVPGARHNESLRGEIWREIEHWLDEVLSGDHRARHSAASQDVTISQTSKVKGWVLGTGTWY